MTTFSQDQNNIKNQLRIGNQQQHSYFSSLHQSALSIAKEIHHQEYLMIEVLQRIDKDKVYRFLKFTSLYQYAVVGLGLSEYRAYNFILVARKASQVEKLQVALQNNEITLSKAKRLTSVIDSENADQWLKLSKNLSQRELERAVAKVNPKSQIEEGTRFVSEDTLELKAAISLDTEKLIKRVQDLLCQSQGRAMSFDETLKSMAQAFLDKKDPVLVAERVLKRELKKVAKKDKSQRLVNADECKSEESVSERQSPFRKPIPKVIKRAVTLRDQGQCQVQVLGGAKCSNQRWIDIHHIKPVSQGGLNTIDNLVTLCRAHHQIEHSYLSG